MLLPQALSEDKYTAAAGIAAGILLVKEDSFVAVDTAVEDIAADIRPVEDNFVAADTVVAGIAAVDIVAESRFAVAVEDSRLEERQSDWLR